jgi:hypothetical protein
MSFDLYFCWHNKQAIDFDAVDEWTQQHGLFKRKGDQLWYDNPDTGVYFSLDFEIKDPEELLIPRGYLDSGLSFNLNFNRPSFFAHEAMPIVADLCQNLGLVAFDPQAPDEQAISENPEASVLTNSWMQHNQQAITALELEGVVPLPRMRSAASINLWNYSRDRQKFQATVGEDIFVPTLLPFRKTGSGDVTTAIVCSSGVPMIVPESTWVIITRPKKRWMGLSEDTETGVLSARSFYEALGNFILPFERWNRTGRFISPESAIAVAKVLKSINSLIPTQEFETVARDGFIDLEDEMLGRTN